MKILVRTLLMIVIITTLLTGPVWGAEGGLLYVISSMYSNLLVYDTSTGENTGNILLGQNPFHIAASPDGKWLAVSHITRLEKIWIIDREKKEVVKKLEVYIGRYRQVGRTYLLFSKDGEKLYAVDSETRFLDIFRTSDWRYIKKVPLGIKPQRPILSPDGKLLLVPNTYSKEVLVVNTEDDEILDSIKIDGYPSAAAISPDGRILYLTDIENDRMIVLDLASKRIIKTISVGTKPVNLLLVEGGKYLYALSNIGGYLSVIDTMTNKNIKTIDATKIPTGMTYDADGGKLYIQAQVASVLVVDTRKMERLNNIIPGRIVGVGSLLFVPGED